MQNLLNLDENSKEFNLLSADRELFSLQSEYYKNPELWSLIIECRTALKDTLDSFRNDDDDSFITNVKKTQEKAKRIKEEIDKGTDKPAAPQAPENPTDPEEIKRKNIEFIISTLGNMARKFGFTDVKIEVGDAPVTDVAGNKCHIKISQDTFDPFKDEILGSRDEIFNKSYLLKLLALYIEERIYQTKFYKIQDKFPMYCTIAMSERYMDINLSNLIRGICDTIDELLSQESNFTNEEIEYLKDNNRYNRNRGNFHFDIKATSPFTVIPDEEPNKEVDEKYDAIVINPYKLINGNQYTLTDNKMIAEIKKLIQIKIAEKTKKPKDTEAPESRTDPALRSSSHSEAAMGIPRHRPPPPRRPREPEAGNVEVREIAEDEEFVKVDPQQIRREARLAADIRRSQVRGKALNKRSNNDTKPNNVIIEPEAAQPEVREVKEENFIDRNRQQFRTSIYNTLNNVIDWWNKPSRKEVKKEVIETRTTLRKWAKRTALVALAGIGVLAASNYGPNIKNILPDFGSSTPAADVIKAGDPNAPTMDQKNYIPKSYRKKEARPSPFSDNN